ncbi:ferredoxin [Candidatus Woesearchaeota archaeon]|nr:ferredoxin [Candidatus Woesearchaeota archaeon]
MAKYKIVYERNSCIGVASCAAVNGEFWVMDQSGDEKADIAKGKNPTITKEGNQELIIEEKDLAKNIEAAENCPVNIIHIYNLETGERLI